MFSFVGDVVLDPFVGTGTTIVASARWGRNSVGVEIDPHYFDLARNRFEKEMNGLFNTSKLKLHSNTQEH
jgi:DNA modification methylase